MERSASSSICGAGRARRYPAAHPQAPSSSSSPHPPQGDRRAGGAPALRWRPGARSPPPPHPLTSWSSLAAMARATRAPPPSSSSSLPPAHPPPPQPGCRARAARPPDSRGGTSWKDSDWPAGQQRGRCLAPPAACQREGRHPCPGAAPAHPGPLPAPRLRRAGSGERGREGPSGAGPRCEGPRGAAATPAGWPAASGTSRWSCAAAPWPS